MSKWAAALVALCLAGTPAVAVTKQATLTIGITIVSSGCTASRVACPAALPPNGASTVRTPAAPSYSTFRPATGIYPALLTTTY